MRPTMWVNITNFINLGGWVGGADFPRKTWQRRLGLSPSSISVNIKIIILKQKITNAKNKELKNGKNGEIKAINKSHRAWGTKNRGWYFERSINKFFSTLKKKLLTHTTHSTWRGRLPRHKTWNIWLSYGPLLPFYFNERKSQIAYMNILPKVLRWNVIVSTQTTTLCCPSDRRYSKFCV